MRELTYKIELAGNGYIVSGNNGSFDCFEACRQTNLRQPIQMKMAKRDNSEEAWKRLLRYIGSDCFELPKDQENTGNEFADNIIEIMMGNHPDWELSGFKVFAGGVQLFYVNEAKDDRVNFWICGYEFLNLIFEGPQSKSGITPTYHLTYTATATILEEDFGNSHRRLQFRIKDRWKDDSHDIFHNDNTIVTITEFIGF